MGIRLRLPPVIGSRDHRQTIRAWKWKKLGEEKVMCIGSRRVKISVIVTSGLEFLTNSIMPEVMGRG